METQDEVRYWRNLLLLGEGSMLLLRQIVVQETVNTNKTLEVLLLDNKHLFSRMKKDQCKLYPTQTTANADLDTWDFSILCLVVKKLCYQSLPHLIVSDIEALKGYRNSLQGHPNRMSMAEAEYISNRNHVIDIMRRIATYIQQTDPIEDLIKRTGDIIDRGSLMQQVKDTMAFSDSIQRILKDKISSLEKDMATVKETIDANEKCRKEAHEETKGILQYLKESYDYFKLTLSSLKESVGIGNRNQEEARDNERNRLQTLQASSENTVLDLATVLGRLSKIHRSNVHKARHDLAKELKTIIHAECDDEEKREQATDLLLTFVNIIQNKKGIGKYEIKHIIRQRIEWYDVLTLQLMDDMIEWFTDIYEHCDDTGDARRGSIHLPIYCSSMNSLFTLLDYIYSNQSKQSLARISSTISRMFSVPFSLSWKTEPISLQKAMSSFLDTIEPESSKKNIRSLILPFYGNDTKQVRNVWRMFGGEDKSVQLEKVSGTLSKIFGEKILLKTSVDKSQFLEIVNQTVEDNNRAIHHLHCTALEQSPENFLSDAYLKVENRSEMNRSYGPLLESIGFAPGKSSYYVLEPEDGGNSTEMFRSHDALLEQSSGLYPGQRSDKVREPDAITKGIQGDLKLDKFESFSSIVDPSCFDLSFLYQIDAPIEIMRMIVIPDNRLLAIGRHDANLYELDTSFKVVKAIALTDFPIDMCYIGQDRAAVCLCHCTVVIVSTTKKYSVETLSEVSRCVSVTFHDNLLYCLDIYGRIYIYDTMMDKVKTTYTVQNFSYGFPHLCEGFMSKGITVSNDGKMIYINNWWELLTTDDKGNILSELPLENPLHSMSIMEDGTILCSFIHERELVQIDQCGRKVLRKIQLPEEPRYLFSMCYDKSKSRLFLVVDESEKVRVYELR